MDLRDVASPEIMAEHAYGRLFEAVFTTPLIDYRHAVVTRNWYDSIVSGYHFHKSGRDCWLDPGGNPGHQGWLFNNTRENWEQRLLNKTHRWWPPGNGRDLCRYLNEESEEVGLKVYAAWAMNSFMNPLLDFRRRRQAAEDQRGWNHTIFLCYENILDMEPSSATNLYSWFFPNRTLKFKMRPAQFEMGRVLDLDPVLWNQLRDKVSKIDVDFYNGMIAKGSAEFGCLEQHNV